MSVFLSRRMLTLISKYGQQITLTKKSDGTYDTSTGQYSQAETPYTAKAYLSNYNLEQINGDTIIKGDRQVLLSKFDTSGDELPEPEGGDIVSVANGDDAKVVMVQKIYSGSDIACYICQVRE